MNGANLKKAHSLGGKLTDIPHDFLPISSRRFRISHCLPLLVLQV